MIQNYENLAYPSIFTFKRFIRFALIFGTNTQMKFFHDERSFIEMLLKLKTFIKKTRTIMQ